MKILTELSEKSLGINPEQKIVGESFKLRKSARAIVINQNGLMAVQHIQKYNYHKLPGGTMEEGEKIEETLRREIREEIGCEIDSIKPDFFNAAKSKFSCMNLIFSGGIAISV